MAGALRVAPALPGRKVGPGRLPCHADAVFAPQSPRWCLHFSLCATRSRRGPAASRAVHGTPRTCAISVPWTPRWHRVFPTVHRWRAEAPSFPIHAPTVRFRGSHGLGAPGPLGAPPPMFTFPIYPALADPAARRALGASDSLSVRGLVFLGRASLGRAERPPCRRRFSSCCGHGHLARLGLAGSPFRCFRNLAAPSPAPSLPRAALPLPFCSRATRARDPRPRRHVGRGPYGGPRRPSPAPRQFLSSIDGRCSDSLASPHPNLRALEVAAPSRSCPLLAAAIAALLAVSLPRLDRAR